VPPYDDPLIIAGQGTIGAEIVEDLRWLNLRPQIVLIGASGGGLAAGIALGIKAKVPAAEIYAVEPEGFDDTLRSFASGQRETNARMSGTICDALMSAKPGALTFPITRELIGQGFTVTDDEVARAMRYAFEDLKLVVQPETRGGAPPNVRYWSNSGQMPFLAGDGLSAYDPQETSPPGGARLSQFDHDQCDGRSKAKTSCTVALLDRYLRLQLILTGRRIGCGG
jgi:hypothetical protein